MNQLKEIFNKKKIISIEEFIDKSLYGKKFGYYIKKNPFGKEGDFITAPLVSPLFSEMIAIWIISFWEKENKPKNFSIVELGPGNGQLSKILNDVFKRFPDFYKAVNIFLYEKSKKLRDVQKKNINSVKVSWISSFKSLKKGPVIFFGNEFFDSIPIKQFVKKNNIFYERFVKMNKNNSIEIINKKALNNDIKYLKKYSTLNKSHFIEYPKQGFKELDKITNVLNKLKGGLLLIDYGYIKQQNKDTIQSIKNKKPNNIFKNFGQSDITYLVNFKLLNEYFSMKKLNIFKIISQSFFLKTIGILKRAEILSYKMTFKEKSSLYARLERLLNPRIMGNLFKVIFVSKNIKKNKLGF